MRALDDREPFTEPWQAQVFALTLHLHDQGVFTWPEWADRFAQTLAAHGLDRELDGGDDYFTAWLAALESLLAERNIAPPEDVTRLRGAWETAYLETPHGAPVYLKE